MADAALNERLQRAADPAAFFRTFMDAQAAALGKERWCTHTHNDLYHLPSIFAMYPEAKVVLCVRHPLDFLASYRNKWQRNLRLNRPERAYRIRQLYHPVVTSFFWLMNVGAIEGALRRWSGRVLLLRYEDLVQQPETSVRRLCDFVGEDFASEMLRPSFNNSSYRMDSGEIFASSMGRWKESLPASHAYVAQLICRRVMRRFGYDPVPLGPARLAAVGHMLSAPLTLLKILVARARMLRGPWFARWVVRRLASTMAR
jgi:hypothetical protein